MKEEQLLAYLKANEVWHEKAPSLTAQGGGFVSVKSADAREPQS